MASILEAIRGRLVVSCQAQSPSPLATPSVMAAMARAAEMAGAAGLRLNGPDDIRETRKLVRIPIIGINKRRDLSPEVYITPTLEDATAVRHAGADIVAIDATRRPRASGLAPQELIAAIHASMPSTLVMADVSTFEEGVAAAEHGADIVATTLSGYTDYSPRQPGPDLELVQRLAGNVSVPIIAEGRYWLPDEVAAAFAAGAYSVVVGTAITNPIAIAQRFIRATPEGPRSPREGKPPEHADNGDGE